MPLAVPDGAHCFVDANILHYALVPTFDTSPACLALLDRAIDGRVFLWASPQVLGDALHKVMMSEAARLAGRDRTRIVGYLKKHPKLIGQLVEWPHAIERLKVVPMQLLQTDADSLQDATRIACTHGLLTSDALTVALMQRRGIVHLATNDDDFDRVPDITVWKPRP
jgi:predicted nucleic acid-binding protein